MAVLTKRQEKLIDQLLYDHAAGTDPAEWQPVLSVVWRKYKDGLPGAAMRSRYYSGEHHKVILARLNISQDTFFRLRQELLISAAIEAARRGIKF